MFSGKGKAWGNIFTKGLKTKVENFYTRHYTKDNSKWNNLVSFLREEKKRAKKEKEKPKLLIPAYKKKKELPKRLTKKNALRRIVDTQQDIRELNRRLSVCLKTLVKPVKDQTVKILSRKNKKRHKRAKVNVARATKKLACVKRDSLFFDQIQMTSNRISTREKHRLVSKVNDKLNALERSMKAKLSLACRNRRKIACVQRQTERKMKLGFYVVLFSRLLPMKQALDIHRRKIREDAKFENCRALTQRLVRPFVEGVRRKRYMAAFGRFKQYYVFYRLWRCVKLKKEATGVIKGFLFFVKKTKLMILMTNKYRNIITSYQQQVRNYLKFDKVRFALNYLQAFILEVRNIVNMPSRIELFTHFLALEHESSESDSEGINAKTAITAKYKGKKIQERGSFSYLLIPHVQRVRLITAFFKKKRSEVLAHNWDVFSGPSKATSSTTDTSKFEGEEEEGVYGTGFYFIGEDELRQRILSELIALKRREIEIRREYIHEESYDMVVEELQMEADKELGKALGFIVRSLGRGIVRRYFPELGKMKICLKQVTRRRNFDFLDYGLDIE